MTSNDPLQTLSDFPDSEARMPVLFVGHGNPMNAIEDNEFSRAWIQAGRSLPKPRAILCISAHWETAGTQVTAMEQPETIHDFYGFPAPLFAMQYPAPGSPGLARLVQETVRSRPVQPVHDWGLDHGTWSVLTRMFPEADIPVIQLSLDHYQSPEFHYALGQELRALRQRGVLIVGSGNMVHNLRLISWDRPQGGFDWAEEFDQTLKELIEKGDHSAIVHYEKLGQAARLSIPTNEHYLPLLYILALQEPGEQIHFFADQLTMGSLSMRSLKIE